MYLPSCISVFKYIYGLVCVVASLCLTPFVFVCTCDSGFVYILPVVIQKQKAVVLMQIAELFACNLQKHAVHILI